MNDLKDSIQDFGDVNLVEEGGESVTSALQKIHGDANALVSAAQSDFPSQTNAIRTSVDQLITSPKQLPNPPTRQAVTSLAGEVTSTVTAVKNLASETSSKCA